MHRTILISLLWGSACFAADTNYVTTDKIHLLLYDDGSGKYDAEQKIVFNTQQVPMIFQMDIDKITHVEVKDVSSKKHLCRGNYFFPPLSSPSTIASFTLDPKANIKKINFRIKLPCAAYERDFYIEIKVTSLGGNYIMRKKVPIIISIPGDGA